VTRVRAAHLTWRDYQECIASDVRVYVPVGAFEQHGLHLPLNTDTIVAQLIAERVAERLNDIVLAPIEYGAHSLPRSGGGDTFPATTNISGNALSLIARDIIREQIRHGVRDLVFVLGHGENEPFILEGAAEAIDSKNSKNRVMVTGWWHYLSEDDLNQYFPNGFPGWDLEHAARVETALMMSLAPELVSELDDRPIDGVNVRPITVLPHERQGVPRQGSLSDPRGATREMGDDLINRIVVRMAKEISVRLS
jgi:creatinine amidohydrolase